jgi:hypothetical protein
MIQPNLSGYLLVAGFVLVLLATFSGPPRLYQEPSSEKRLEIIAQTLKLPYVAILLPEGNRERVAAAYGKPTPDTVQFPLTYQGEDIGQLFIASRSAGTSFNCSEMRLLRNIARQAGAGHRTGRSIFGRIQKPKRYPGVC